VESGDEEGKIRSFLGEPERPKVLHFASESTDQPFDLGKQFKSEERAELWLNVSEATTAIEMVLAKCRVR